MISVPRYARKGLQVTLEDLVIEYEIIPGAIPAAADEAVAARDRFYRDIAAGCTGTCIPDQKIHIYAIGASTCVCAAKKESK